MKKQPLNDMLNNNSTTHLHYLALKSIMMNDEMSVCRDAVQQTDTSTHRYTFKLDISET